MASDQNYYTKIQHAINNIQKLQVKLNLFSEGIEADFKQLLEAKAKACADAQPNNQHQQWLDFQPAYETAKTAARNAYTLYRAKEESGAAKSGLWHQLWLRFDSWVLGKGYDVEIKAQLDKLDYDTRQEVLDQLTGTPHDEEEETDQTEPNTDHIHGQLISTPHDEEEEIDQTEPNTDHIPYWYRSELLKQKITKELAPTETSQSAGPEINTSWAHKLSKYWQSFKNRIQNKRKDQPAVHVPVNQIDYVFNHPHKVWFKSFLANDINQPLSDQDQPTQQMRLLKANRIYQRFKAWYGDADHRGPRGLENAVKEHSGSAETDSLKEGVQESGQVVNNLRYQNTLAAAGINEYGTHSILCHGLLEGVPQAVKAWRQRAQYGWFNRAAKRFSRALNSYYNIFEGNHPELTRCFKSFVYMPAYLLSQVVVLPLRLIFNTFWVCCKWVGDALEYGLSMAQYLIPGYYAQNSLDHGVLHKLNRLRALEKQLPDYDHNYNELEFKNSITKFIDQAREYQSRYEFRSRYQDYYQRLQYQLLNYYHQNKQTYTGQRIAGLIDTKLYNDYQEYVSATSSSAGLPSDFKSFYEALASKRWRQTQYLLEHGRFEGYVYKLLPWMTKGRYEEDMIALVRAVYDLKEQTKDPEVASRFKELFHSGDIRDVVLKAEDILAYCQSYYVETLKAPSQRDEDKRNSQQKTLKRLKNNIHHVREKYYMPKRVVHLQHVYKTAFSETDAAALANLKRDAGLNDTYFILPDETGYTKRQQSRLTTESDEGSDEESGGSQPQLMPQHDFAIIRQKLEKLRDEYAEKVSHNDLTPKQYKDYINSRLKELERLQEKYQRGELLVNKEAVEERKRQRRKQKRDLDFRNKMIAGYVAFGEGGVAAQLFYVAAAALFPVVFATPVGFAVMGAIFLGGFISNFVLFSITGTDSQYCISLNDGTSYNVETGRMLSAKARMFITAADKITYFIGLTIAFLSYTSMCSLLMFALSSLGLAASSNPATAPIAVTLFAAFLAFTTFIAIKRLTFHSYIGISQSLEQSDSLWGGIKQGIASYLHRFSFSYNFNYNSQWDVATVPEKLAYGFILLPLRVVVEFLSVAVALSITTLSAIVEFFLLRSRVSQVVNEVLGGIGTPQYISSLFAPLFASLSSGITVFCGDYLFDSKHFLSSNSEIKDRVLSAFRHIGSGTKSYLQALYQGASLYWQSWRYGDQQKLEAAVYHWSKASQKICRFAVINIPLAFIGFLTLPLLAVVNSFLPKFNQVFAAKEGVSEPAQRTWGQEIKGTLTAITGTVLSPLYVPIYMAKRVYQEKTKAARKGCSKNQDTELKFFEAFNLVDAVLKGGTQLACFFNTFGLQFGGYGDAQIGSVRSILGFLFFSCPYAVATGISIFVNGFTSLVNNIDVAEAQEYAASAGFNKIDNSSLEGGLNDHGPANSSVQDNRYHQALFRHMAKELELNSHDDTTGEEKREALAMAEKAWLCNGAA